MDPNSPMPPAPEQTPAPQPPTPSEPQQPPQNAQPPQKPNKGLIFGIIGGVLFLILIGIGIAIVSATMLNKDTSETTRTDDSAKVEDTDDTAKSEGSVITAKTLVELREACIGGSITNAAPLTKPYRYVIYENNNSGNAEKEAWKWDMYAVGSNDESIALDTRSAPSELNVVVCLDRDDSTAVKAGTCKLERSAGMESTDSTVANFYAVKYTVTFYEAQTGKKLKEMSPINGPASECPPLAYYNTEGDPSVYGDPDITELNERIEAFES